LGASVHQANLSLARGMVAMDDRPAAHLARGSPGQGYVVAARSRRWKHHNL
jgi:hypothetical protein